MTIRINIMLQGGVGGALVALLLSGIGYNLNDEQKEVVSSTINLGWQWVTGTGGGDDLPTPQNISEFSEEFNFNTDKESNSLVQYLNDTKFSQMKELKRCVMYEDIAANILDRVIEGIGSDNNMTRTQVETMQLSIHAGRVINAMEIFIHGRKGIYTFMKYTSAKKASGNYDFLIANYGYTWTLDIETAEDTLKKIKAEARLAGVPADLIPDEGRTDVLDFIRVQSQASITMADKEHQTNYFRSLSERSLAFLCPKLNK